MVYISLRAVSHLSLKLQMTMPDTRTEVPPSPEATAGEGVGGGEGVTCLPPPKVSEGEDIEDRVNHRIVLKARYILA